MRISGVQACFNELGRDIPGKFRGVAKAATQVIAERLRGHVPSGFGVPCRSSAPVG